MCHFVVKRTEVPLTYPDRGKIIDEIHEIYEISSTHTGHHVNIYEDSHL